MAEVVRHGRLRWFGHLECLSGDDWVSTCGNVEVEGSGQGQEDLVTNGESV